MANVRKTIYLSKFLIKPFNCSLSLLLISVTMLSNELQLKAHKALNLLIE